MSNQSSTLNDKPKTIEDIIREIETKSKGGGYIYRGERKCNPKVSSKLYRDFEIETEGFDIELVQKEMLTAAKKHTGDLPQDFRLDVIASPNTIDDPTQEIIDLEILTEIQHYGGKTNLIDFTTDYLIALFFACDGHHDKKGRVILQKTDKIRDMIEHPRNPRHRVITQKSVFIRPPKGFVEPSEDEIVTIPANLKQTMLEHLRNYHAIFTETIYNDLHGFIRNQDIHGDAYTEFYRGLACQYRGDEATTSESKREKYEKSIKHYTKATELKPDFTEAHNNRGSTYSDKGDYDLAIQDFNKAIELKPDDVMIYNNRGMTYGDKGDYDLAIQDFNKALELKPDDVDVYINRGTTYGDKGDYDLAIQDFNKAIELKPDDVMIYNNRGMTYGDKGDYDLAIQDFDKVIELNPEHDIAYCNRGEAWLHLQEWDKAKSDLTTAKNMGLDIITSFYNWYSSIEDFEQETGIQLPEDLAEMLTPP